MAAFSASIQAGGSEKAGAENNTDAVNTMVITVTEICLATCILLFFSGVRIRLTDFTPCSRATWTDQSASKETDHTVFKLNVD